MTLPARESADFTAAAAARSIRSGFLLVEPDRRALLAVTELVETGRPAVHIDAVFPPAETALAHALGETGRTVGTLVLTVD
ncbi:zinc-binding dehydrogenase [Kitasatospora sp. NPDC094011]|uniref:zinc-binding dehydrogenase n=1 Tax=Kitasatospora sp. NPDC094011 TaxID=3364090 RepID=UPI003809BE32